MKHLIVLFLLVAPLLAGAQTAEQPYCLPNNKLLKGDGTDYGLFETADVSGRVGWCPSTNGGWHIVVHQWNLKKTRMSAADPWAALDRVRAASEPLKQLATEWKAFAVPLVDPLDTWLYKDWRYQACKWLTTAPYPMAPPNGFPSGWVFPATYCEVWNPGPKPAPSTAWKAVGGTIFKYSSGKLTTVVSGKVAAKDAPCTGVTVATAGTFVYQELVGGTAGEATRCVKP